MRHHVQLLTQVLGIKAQVLTRCLPTPNRPPVSTEVAPFRYVGRTVLFLFNIEGLGVGNLQCGKEELSKVRSTLCDPGCMGLVLIHTQ